MTWLNQAPTSRNALLKSSVLLLGLVGRCPLRYVHVYISRALPPDTGLQWLLVHGRVESGNAQMMMGLCVLRGHKISFYYVWNGLLQQGRSDSSSKCSNFNNNYRFFRRKWPAWVAPLQLQRLLLSPREPPCQGCPAGSSS